MSYEEIKRQLLSGQLDEHLDELKKLIAIRKNTNAPKIWDFNVGDVVRLNNSANPKYLAGAMAKVTKVNRTRVVIDLDIPHGRFYKNITAPLGLIERV